MYISGRFRCNPYRKRQELAGIDLVSSRFRQDPLDRTIDLGLIVFYMSDRSLVTENAMIITFVHYDHRMDKLFSYTTCPFVTESRFFILYFQYLNGTKSDNVEIFRIYLSRIALHIPKASLYLKLPLQFYD